MCWSDEVCGETLPWAGDKAQTVLIYNTEENSQREFSYMYNEYVPMAMCVLSPWKMDKRHEKTFH